MTRGPSAATLGLVLFFAAPAPAAEPLQEVRRQWSKLDRAGKLDGLLRLGAAPSRPGLAQCRTWLKDEDPVVRAHVVRLVAAHCAVQGCRVSAEGLIAEYVKGQLAARARRERKEFEQVCREHGRTAPPGDQIAAGKDWTDPYDEKRRRLPGDIKAERVHMREVIAAVEGVKSPELYPILRSVFDQHHDPEVVVRAVRAFQATREWRALPAMADLARIQRYGREMGGAMVIGKRKYETLRLKWDVHKDRLWWSRPEYVPRAIDPVCEAASAVTGARITTVTELDAWLLANEAALSKHGVKLSAAFKKRAAATQR